MKNPANPDMNRSAGFIDTLTITNNGYSGNIPVVSIMALEHEVTGLVHGVAVLELHVRDGKLARFVTRKERSFITGVDNEQYI